MLVWSNRAPLFTVLVVVWVACGAVTAAWLLWDRHSQYERHREEALGVWCKERALMLQQLVLAHAGQMHTLGGVDLWLISVMGKPGQGSKWEMGGCLNGSMWGSFLTRTAQTRPGNTGALACAVVYDAERADFEKQYGSIRDNTLIVSTRRPIYCPKIFELTTLFATNGPSNVDMSQRFYSFHSLVEEGRHFYTWPYPLANPLTHAGFGVSFPLRRSVPTNHSRQSAAGPVYGSLAASVDVTYIAQKVLEELYEPDSSEILKKHTLYLLSILPFPSSSLSLPTLQPSQPSHPDPSKSFELYDITDPATLFAIVSPVPPHAYFRPDDKLPYMHPSPESETRPWEHRAVVPLEEMGAGVRKYEVWHTQPSNLWQSWGVPILIALFALFLVLLVLLAACLQRAKFLQTQQQVAEADRLRRQAERAEVSKSMFVACMSHELRTPMIGIIGTAFLLHSCTSAASAAFLQCSPCILWGMQIQQQVAEADRLRREAEGAEASKSMFVACMSHELRTPMVGITGVLDALADMNGRGISKRCTASGQPLPSLGSMHTCAHVLPPGLLDALADMSLSASQLADLLMAGASARDALHLVNRVLDLAKLEAGKAVVDETVIDVREWLDATLHWHAEEARSKGIELSSSVSTDCPSHVIVDPLLLSNALKEITAPSFDMSVFTLPGVAGAKGSEEWVRGSTGARVGTANGTGAVVGAAAAAGADEAVTRAWVGGLRVLVVDDTPVNLLVARRSLARWGARVTTASHGQQAVDLIAAGLQESSLARCGALVTTTSIGLEAIESIAAGLISSASHGQQAIDPLAAGLVGCGGWEEEERGKQPVGEEGRQQQEARGEKETRGKEEGRGKQEARGQEEGRGKQLARGQEEGDASLQHGFDLVLMDLQMPGMNGFAAAAAIRALERRMRFETISRAQKRQQQTPCALCIPLLEASNPAAAGTGVGTVAAAAGGDGGWVGSLRVPIVALTADVDRRVVQRCAEGGFDGVLQKPVDAHLLAARLSQMHSQRSLLQIMPHPNTGIPPQTDTIDAAASDSFEC
ncbi:unnamed protein product [Closterium sp. NIES-64]|nr:unnamed protein product [Closterium sp. NIES-64]